MYLMYSFFIYIFILLKVRGLSEAPSCSLILTLAHKFKPEDRISTQIWNRT